MKRTEYHIIELFEIADRGTVIVVNEIVNLNGGKPVPIQITRSDGSAFAGIAFVKRVLRRVLSAANSCPSDKMDRHN